MWPRDILARETGLSVLICLRKIIVCGSVWLSNIPALANPWLGQDFKNKEWPFSFPGTLWTNDFVAFPGSSAPSGHWPGHGQLAVQIACVSLQLELSVRMRPSASPADCSQSITQCAAVAWITSSIWGSGWCLACSPSFLLAALNVWLMWPGVGWDPATPAMLLGVAF